MVGSLGVAGCLWFADDGGHYIAPRFKGPTDAFNHFAQNRTVNRGRYRVMEDRWAQALKQGKKVYVEIRPAYAGHSKRPFRLDVKFDINGQQSIDRFSNE
jgi:hypothetical protein